MKSKEIVMKRIQRIRRSVTILAGLAGILLALAAAAPAALATLPPPAPAVPVPTHTVVTGGMPGWQIVLIATGAALAAAVIAVILDRIWTGRRHLTHPATRPSIRDTEEVTRAS
jgi:hypothetical protein